MMTSTTKAHNQNTVELMLSLLTNGTVETVKAWSVSELETLMDLLVGMTLTEIAQQGNEELDTLLQALTSHLLGRDLPTVHMINAICCLPSTCEEGDDLW